VDPDPEVVKLALMKGNPSAYEQINKKLGTKMSD
jgi:hypothetical protein